MPHLKHNEILIQPEGGKSTCRIFNFPYPPEDFEISDDKRGLLFGLIEIKLPPNRKIKNFLNTLLEEIKITKPTLRDEGDQKSPDLIFENLIQQINYKFIELLGKKPPTTKDEIPIAPSNINALLALISGKDLCLAQRGKIYPFLVFQSKPQSNKIINILENASGQEGRANNINLFTNIVSGKINDNNVLLFSTESLLDYFSLEKLCKIVSTASPEEASNNLKKLLEETANPQTLFAALIIKLQPQREPEIIQQETPTAQITMPQSSMTELFKTAADTEKFLNPSLRLNIGKGLMTRLGRIKNLLVQKEENQDKTKLEYYSSRFTPPASSKILKIFKSIYFLLLLILRALYLFIKKTISILAIFLKSLFYLITNKNNLRKKTIENLGKNLLDIKSKFTKLTRPSKILLISSLFFACLFLGSTVTLYYKYKKENVLKDIQQKIEIIQSKKSAAEASLIYNDEKGAKKLLEEAEILLAELTQKSKNKKKKYENLEKEIALLREKLRRVTKIENPTLIVNFADQNTNAKVNEFLIAKNNLYAFDQQTSVLYKVNLTTKEIINKSTAGLNLMFGILKDENSALFYQPERKLFEYDLENDVLKQLDITFNENETKIADFDLYNQRFYSLDTEYGQIFKHLPTMAGFSRGTPWLQESLDIKNATSLAIDGSIYLTNSDGEILKLNAGKKTDFEIDVDPALNQPNKIWTSSDSSFLYILESSGKRLVVFDKEGKLKTQYFFEQFNDLKDFVVLEKEKKIYLLNGTQIYNVDATHLQ